MYLEYVRNLIFRSNLSSVPVLKTSTINIFISVKRYKKKTPSKDYKRDKNPKDKKVWKFGFWRLEITDTTFIIKSRSVHLLTTSLTESLVIGDRCATYHQHA